MGTIIFHLLLAIILLCVGISGIKMPEAFEVEVAELQQEEKKKREEELERREEVRKRTSEEEVQKMLRSIAVNANAKNTSQTEEHIREYIEEIERELNSNRTGQYKPERDKNYTADSLQHLADRQQQLLDSLQSTVSSGESSVSYDLAGRYARVLPIPVFRCEFGGRVVVVIAVDRKGVVQKAEVDMSRFQGDDCLLEVARDAALRSRFNESAQAPVLQQGTLVFNFVKQ